MIEEQKENEQRFSKLFRDMKIKIFFLIIGLWLIYISQDFMISATEYRDKFGLNYPIYILMLAITIVSSLIKYRDLIRFKRFKQVALTSIILFILGFGFIVFKTQDLAWTYLVYNLKYYAIFYLSGSFMAISFELLTAIKGESIKLLKKYANIEDIK